MEPQLESIGLVNSELAELLCFAIWTNSSERTSVKLPCGICHKKYPEPIFYTYCKFWVHIKWDNISIYEYFKFEKEGDNVPWFCLQWITVLFLFGSMDTEELSNQYDCDLPSCIDSVPSFQITFGLINFRI